MYYSYRFLISAGGIVLPVPADVLCAAICVCCNTKDN